MAILHLGPSVHWALAGCILLSSIGSSAVHCTVQSRLLMLNDYGRTFRDGDVV
ncbi:hypothetical protein L873DRAFT_1803447 [Choiromyces venosus 120613-1]|uniref:Uncharacterized protein n=1 Tax=Choiromyces venosus 120613-1 TaxID=1336337 RepID=A0A3N4JX93_9PEZI|nr:hypothetical protein L873DRAFT_1803447 [Choiromyces venosus 120613-1]